MAKQQPWYYWQEHTLYLHVYVQPRASTDKIVGLHDDCLKIRLTAPPLEGKANAYLIKFLARCVKVTERQVVITHGEQSRKKWISIDSPNDLTLFRPYLDEDRISK